MLQIQPRRLLANPLKFKRLARVKFKIQSFQNHHFSLAFVWAGCAGVVAGLGNVEDASVAAASERLCAFIHLLGSAPFRSDALVAECEKIGLCRLADIGDFLKIARAFTQILLQSLFRFRQTRHLDKILKPLERAEFQNLTRVRQVLKFYPRGAKNF